MYHQITPLSATPNFLDVSFSSQPYNFEVSPIHVPDVGTQIEPGPKNIDFIRNLSLILTFQSSGRIWRGVPNSWGLVRKFFCGRDRLGNVALRTCYTNSGASLVVVNRGFRLR